MIIPALVLLCVFALFTNALLRPTTRVGYLLGLLLISAGEVVLITELSSLPGWTNAAFFLFAHAVLAVAAWRLWCSRGKPPLLGPVADGKWRFWHELAPFRDAPFLWILAVGVGAAFMIGAIQIILLPPNNYDSLTYHIARVGYWLQHQSLAVWNTPNTRQVAFPPNAEIGILWTVIFTGSDRFSGFVQWFAAAGSALAIAGLSRQMGGSRQQSLFAGLIWATFPQVILQSTTTQNDLVITLFALACVYFLRLALKTGLSRYSFLSGVALGLAFGTKSTFIFFIPGLAAAVVVWFLFLPDRRWKVWRSWVISCLAGALIFGSFIYIQNLVKYQNLLGPAETSSPEVAPATDRLTTAFYDSLLYTYQMFDGSGLPREVDEPFMQFKRRVFGKLFRELGVNQEFAKYSIQQIMALPTRIHEDISWFGPLGFIAFIPALLIQAFLGFKKRDYDRLALLALGAGFSISLCFLLGWTLYKGRYFVLGVGLCAPLLAILYHPRKWLFHAVVILFGLSTVFFTIANNEAKPVLGPNSVLQKDRTENRTLNVPYMTPITKKVDEEIPGKAVIATKLGPNGLDRLFFGENFEHNLVQVDHEISAKDISILREIGAGYLVVGPREQFFIQPPPGLELMVSMEQTLIFRVNRDEIGTPRQSNPYPPTDVHRLIFTSPELQFSLGVLESWGGQGSVEQFLGNGFIWLGQGEVQGFGMKVIAETDLALTLLLDVEPGPARTDPARTLVVETYTADGKHAEYPSQFSASTQLRIQLKIKEGINEIGMYVLEQADTSVPGGDPRTRLVKVTRMQFVP